MANDVKKASVILTLSGLILLSSGYIVEFHRWAMFYNENQLVSSSLEVVKSTGIRQIVSTDSVEEHTLASKVYSPDSVKFSSIGLDKKPIDQQDFIDTSARVLVPAVFKTEAEDSRSSTQTASLPLPFIVDLEEEILVEFAEGYRTSQIKKAIVRLLTLPIQPQPQHLFSNEPINTREKPYYFRRVLNQFNTSIRYPAQAYRYTDYLLSNNAESIQDEQGQFTLVRIPKNTLSMPQGIKQYHHLVEQYADEFSVPEELIYAIIDTESYFDPKAVSKSKALGLMQIKPKSAGRDVYHHIDNRRGYPSRDVLFDPKENIRIGVAYISLLNNKYLKNVRNPKSKEMLMVASYNGGLSKSLNLFGDSPEKAVARINQLYPRNIYRKLRYSHVSGETRQYVDKVLGKKDKYAKLLQHIS